MDFLSLAQKRYSVRTYTARQVEQEKLALVLQAAQAAPTGANRQPQRLLVVQSPEGLAKLGKGAELHGAPTAILVCADRDKTWTRPFDQKKLTDIDASIVTDHMMLAATDLGLGSLWICYFDPAIIRREFALPAQLEPINLLALGYADTSREPPSPPNRHAKMRKPLAETVFYEAL